MFCFQCEQTAGGKGCTKGGVCGKPPEVANKQDELTSALIGLARAAQGKKPGKEADELVMQGLFTSLTNVNFDAKRIDDLKIGSRLKRRNWAGPMISILRTSGMETRISYLCVPPCFLD